MTHIAEPESAHHLLEECPEACQAVSQAMGQWLPRERTTGGGIAEAVLGGGLPAAGVAAAVRLAGRLARRTARLRPAAEKQQEEVDFLEFLRQSGVVPLVQGSARSGPAGPGAPQAARAGAATPEG